MNVINNRAAWLMGPAASCDHPPRAKPTAFHFVLLGAPGAGKGTQAALLASRLGACQLSTGDIFRAAQAIEEERRSPALRRALDAMQRGELVADDTVVGIVGERHTCLRCGGGFLLDGFPRTVRQAEALAELLAHEYIELDAALNYELPLDVLVERLSGRRVCEQCKSVYHVESRPPQVEGLCDDCGGRLIHREDDRQESVRVRMAAYEASTAPLIEYYRKRDLLVSVPAEGTPDDVYHRSLELLELRSHPSKRSVALIR